MSMRVQGTCHSREWLGRQPMQGSPLSQVFLRNLHRRHARNFLISLACLRCSGRRGPRLRPTFFSESFFAGSDLRLMAGLLFLVEGLLRVGAAGAVPCEEEREIGAGIDAGLAPC